MTDTLTASASAVVDAPADEVFAYICRPTAHPAISGDGSVRGIVTGPEQLTGKGDRFGTRMKMYGLPYRITNTVVEFEPGKRIAWSHPGKHRWRWEVEALPDGRSTVTETFDMSPSPLKPALRLLGYPGAHQSNVERSVANVARHFAD